MAVQVHPDFERLVGCIRNWNLHAVIGLASGTQFGLDGGAGRELNGGGGLKVDSICKVRRGIAVFLTERIRRQRIAVRQFPGKELVGSGFEVGEPEFAIGPDAEDPAFVQRP